MNDIPKTLTLYGEWNPGLVELLHKVGQLDVDKQQQIVVVIRNELEFIAAEPLIEMVSRNYKMMTQQQVQENIERIYRKFSPQNPHLHRLQYLVSKGWPWCMDRQTKPNASGAIR